MVSYVIVAHMVCMTHLMVVKGHKDNKGHSIQSSNDSSGQRCDEGTICKSVCTS